MQTPHQHQGQWLSTPIPHPQVGHPKRVLQSPADPLPTGGSSLAPPVVASSRLPSSASGSHLPNEPLVPHPGLSLASVAKQRPGGWAESGARGDRMPHEGEWSMPPWCPMFPQTCIQVLLPIRGDEHFNGGSRQTSRTWVGLTPPVEGLKRKDWGLLRENSASRLHLGFSCSISVSLLARPAAFGLASLTTAGTSLKD